MKTSSPNLRISASDSPVMGVSSIGHRAIVCQGMVLLNTSPTTSHVNISPNIERGLRSSRDGNYKL